MSEGLAWAHGVRYVDTHCHVDLYPDPTSLMREADGHGIGIVAVTNTPSVFEPMVRLAAGFPKVAVALGLHPELAGEREAELRLMPELMQKTDFVGEIGLDGVARDARTVASQRRVLQATLEAAKESGPKTMTVHTRRAARESLETLTDTSGSVILHWFSGTLAQAKEATERGWWFSVNSAMLESAKGRALVQSLPQRVVLTETDGPFTSVDGRPARPSDVPKAVDELAAMWGIDHEVARMRLLNNFRSCLSAAVPGPRLRHCVIIKAKTRTDPDEPWRPVECHVALDEALVSPKLADYFRFHLGLDVEYIRRNHPEHFLAPHNLACAALAYGFFRPRHQFFSYEHHELGSEKDLPSREADVDCLACRIWIREETR